MNWLSGFFLHSLEVCEKQFRAAWRHWLAAFHVIPKGLLVLLTLTFIHLSSIPAQAQITAQVSAIDDNGYGRIVFRFAKLPPYRARISDGVLIISFEEAISLKLDQFMVPLKDYFTIGRIDPDGKSIRFALSRDLRLNTIEAGDRLFIDILPEPWVGLLPGLPQKIIDEISAKNRKDDEEKRKLARIEAFKNSKNILKIRVGEYPTFSRLVFDWDKKVGVKVSRNGKVLNIQFDKLIRTDVTRLKVDPPKFVTGAKSKLTDNGLVVDIMLREDTNIRAFREGVTYVVDVTSSLSAEEEKEYEQPPVILVPDDTNDPSAANVDARKEVVEFNAALSTKVAPEPATPKPASVKSAPVEKKPVKKPSPAVLVKKPDTDQVKDPQMVVSKVSKTGGKSVAMKASGSQMGSEKSETGPAQSLNEQPAEKISSIEKNTASVVKENGKTIKVEAEMVAGNLRLSFPFTQDVPAAVFQRGESLWVIFDTSSKLDMSALDDGQNKFDRISGYNIIPTKDTVALLLKLSRPSLASVARQDTRWLLSVGDFIASPVKPVSLVSGNRSDGRTKITLNLKKPARLHQFKDPEVGDQLAVVTAVGLPQGVVRVQKFVEFSTIITAQGIAVKPSIDDLKINLNSDNVVITRDEGLMLSRVDGASANRVAQKIVDISLSGNVDFAKWAQGGRLRFGNRRAQLERDIASKSELKYTLASRLELAQLYVGNQLGAEALGTLEILKRINPKIENDPKYHALRGVANLMMYRLKAARFDLASQGLAHDNETKLWLGLLEVAEGNWEQARKSFFSGESSMKDFPDEIKALFRISAARANIESNDTSGARYQLAAMPKTNLERKYIAEAAFLNGRILELQARNDEALDYYNEALSYGDRKVESETSFYKTMLRFRLSYIKSDVALEQLESQLIAWRGDEIELKVMRELAKLYVARKRYRRGLETMRTAVTYYRDKKIGRLIQDDMAALFNRIFLGEKIKSLSPLQTLSLFYDFRELTPIGRLGDEMIRRLSDTLISVDLLDQAAEILSHQVEKRLKGAARAQVATRLALVELLRRQPQKALTIIRRTRQAVLPKTVVRRRALLEARALAELNRYDLALSVLVNLKGKDVERARAAVLWRSKRWQNAGEAYERYLGDVWKGATELTDVQRINVLRAAISYTLAEDMLGTKRLATKFNTKMAKSVDAQTFKVITASNRGLEAEFRNIATKIAAIDTLKSFLEEFRKAELSLPSDVALAPQS